MKRIFILALACLWAVALNAQEAQVPVDQEGRMDYVDSEKEVKLGLFPEYKGFIEARLYHIGDSAYALEISYKKDGIRYKDRKTMTADQVRQFRQKVSTRLRSQIPETMINQEGRTKLLISTSLVGLGYYGWVVPEMTRIDDGRLYTGTYMLTAGASFLVPFYLTKDTRVSDASATLFLYGQTRGIVHGILLSNLTQATNYEQILGLGMLMSVGEGIGGYFWADGTNMSSGTSSLIGAMGDMGMFFGAGTAHFTGLLDMKNDERISGGSALAGAALGMTAASLLSLNTNYSRGDAYMFAGAGLLGAYIPFSVMVAIDPEEDKAYTASAVIGSVGGMAAGHFIAKQQDYTTGQGVMILLGELTGGLLGAGTGYLFVGDTDDAPKVVSISGALGALVGFGVMARRYANKSSKEEESAFSFDFNFNVNPGGFFQLDKAPTSAMGRIQEPMFMFRLRF